MSGPLGARGVEPEAVTTCYSVAGGQDIQDAAAGLQKRLKSSLGTVGQRERQRHCWRIAVAEVIVTGEKVGCGGPQRAKRTQVAFSTGIGGNRLITTPEIRRRSFQESAGESGRSRFPSLTMGGGRLYNPAGWEPIF